MHARTTRFLASLALAAATFGANSAEAQSAPLMACFVPRSGTLYLVGQNGTPTACRATDHVLVQWNTVGPAGPAGNTGPQGPAGSPGQQGPPGPVASGTLSGIESVVSAFDGTISAGGHLYLAARCPVGKTAISGGLLRGEFFGTPAGQFSIAELGSYPNWAFGQSSREWIVHVGRSNTESALVVNFNARVVAVCATVS